MNDKGYGFGGGCIELGVVTSTVTGVIAFVIALAVKLLAGMTASQATLNALSVAALSFGFVAVFWLLAFLATYVCPKSKG